MCTVESILIGCNTAWFRNSNGQKQRRLKKVVDIALSTPSMGSTRNVASRRQPISSKTHTTLAMLSSHCYNWEEGTGAWELLSAGSRTVYFHEPSGSWTIVDNPKHNLLHHQNTVDVIYVALLSWSVLLWSGYPASLIIYCTILYSTFICCIFVLLGMQSCSK